MGSEIFSMTPIEAAIWHWAVSAQSYLATELFGSNIFLGVVILSLSIFLLRSFSLIERGEGTDEVGKKIVIRLVILALGLLFLRAINTSPFVPVDSSGGKWSSKGFVISNSKYSNLRNSTDGLYWYTFFHKGGVQLSVYLTNAVNGIFSDPSYPKSPNMLFKVLVGTATVVIDDPRVSESLDAMAMRCSDTANGRVLNKGDSLKVLFDLSIPECQRLYRDLEINLSRWVSRRFPSYLKKFSNLSSSEVSARMVSLQDRTVLENKVISSALLNYAKSKTYGKDQINTNTKELHLTNKWDHFWFTVQRMVSGGAAIPAIIQPFTDVDVEAGIVRNEAGIIYNNLLNLVPPMKGYIKAFVCLSFLIVAALLALGFTRPAIWWVHLLLLEAAYAPLSALNYELCTFFLTSSDVMSSFGDLRNDPMILAAASVIDGQLVRVQTAYFLVQTVICAMFVFGVIRAGFTVRQMSFRGASGAFSMVVNNRLVYGAAGRVAAAGRGGTAAAWRKWRGIDP